MEINKDLKKSYEEASLKNAKLKVLYDLFTTKYLEDSKLDKNLIKKASDIYLSAETAQCSISSNKSYLLRDINAPELRDIEKANLINDFLKTVDQNITELNTLNYSGVDPVESIKLNNITVLELEKTLNESFSRYKNNLIEVSNALEKMIALRNKNVKELCDSKIIEVKLVSEKTSNKIKVLTEEAKSQIVNKKILPVALKKVDDELENNLIVLTEKLSELEIMTNNYKCSIAKPEYKYVLEKFSKAKKDLVFLKSINEKAKMKHF